MSRKGNAVWGNSIPTPGTDVGVRWSVTVSSDKERPDNSFIVVPSIGQVSVFHFIYGKPFKNPIPNPCSHFYPYLLLRTIFPLNGLSSYADPPLLSSPFPPPRF